MILWECLIVIEASRDNERLISSARTCKFNSIYPSIGQIFTLRKVPDITILDFLYGRHLVVSSYIVLKERWVVLALTGQNRPACCSSKVMLSAVFSYTKISCLFLLQLLRMFGFGIFFASESHIVRWTKPCVIFAESCFYT